jgi:hypothetical protein
MKEIAITPEVIGIVPGVGKQKKFFFVMILENITRMNGIA